MLMRTFAAFILCLTPLLAGDSAVRPEVVRLLPPDAVMAGGFDMQALRQSPLFQRLAPSIPFGTAGEAREVLRAIGFDPEKDVRRVIVASYGNAPEDLDSALMIVEGRFDLDGGLLSLFQKAGEHDGVALYTAGREVGKSKTVAFLDDSTAVVSSAGQVGAAIDRWRRPQAVSRTPLVVLAEGGAHVWATSLAPGRDMAGLFDRIPGGGGPMQAIAQSMQAVTFRANLVQGAVNTELSFLCGEARDARSLADAAQTIAALGALGAQHERPALADLLGQLRIRQNESETTVSVTLTEEQMAGIYFQAVSGQVGLPSAR